jgi:hypothetical protein
MLILVGFVDSLLRAHFLAKHSIVLAKAAFSSLTRRSWLQAKESLTRQKRDNWTKRMITTLLVFLVGAVIAVGTIVVVVARAIMPLGRGTLSLEDTYNGPPEAAPAYAELQRLELQYALAEELGSLDAGSLETLRQEIAVAQTRYETAMAQSQVRVEKLASERLDAEAAVSDCLSPIPRTVPVLGIAAAAVSLNNGTDKS